jgi:hypothetical protein
MDFKDILIFPIFFLFTYLCYKWRYMQAIEIYIFSVNIFKLYIIYIKEEIKEYIQICPNGHQV